MFKYLPLGIDFNICFGFGALNLEFETTERSA